MKKKYLLFLMVFLTLCIAQSHAVGAFDSIVKAFETPAKRWGTDLLKVATYLFWFLSMLEFGYQLTFKRLLPNEISKLWVFVIVRIVITSLLSYFVLNLGTYTGIVSWLIKLGSSIGGVDLSGGGLISYSPSTLFGELFGLFGGTLGGLFLAAATTSFLASAVANFMLDIALMILASMLIIVIVVMLTMIEAYFVIFAGFFLVGFAGSSWTMSYWQKYLSYVVAVGIRLFATAIILGIISTQWSAAGSAEWLKPIDWSTLVSSDSSVIANILNNLISMLGVFLFDMVLIITIPAKAAAMLNGAVNAGLGEAIGAAALAMSGGKIAGGMVKAGSGVAKNAASAALGAGGAAKSAAFKAMRTAAKNNIGGQDGAGGDAKWKAMLKQKGQDAAKTSNSEALKGGLNSAKKSFADGTKNSKQAAGQFGNKANSAGSGSSSAPSLNINPHK